MINFKYSRDQTNCLLRQSQFIRVHFFSTGRYARKWASLTQCGETVRHQKLTMRYQFCSGFGGLYTHPHIFMDSMRTAFPLLPLFQEFMKTSHAVHMDFVKFIASLETCDQVSCGLPWTHNAL